MVRNYRLAVCRALAIAIPATALWYLLKAVPFSWDSYIAWSAILVLPIALISFFRPLPGFWIGSRRVAVRVAMVACIALAGALLWPVDRSRVPAPVSMLDGYMPEFDFREYHEVPIEAAADRAWAALQETALSDIPAFAVLGQVRAVAFGHMPNFRASMPNTPMLSTILRPGSAFFELDQKPGEEIVIGMAGRPWANRAVRLGGGAQFRNWSEPDSVRIASNFLIRPEGPGRSTLITETRIQATDLAGARHFGRYWRLVYPGSAVIRHQLLQAVAARAH